MVLLLRIFSALVLVTHGHLRSESIGSVWTTGSNEISNETFDVIQTKTNYTEKTKSIGFMNTDAPVFVYPVDEFFPGFSDLPRHCTRLGADYYFVKAQLESTRRVLVLDNRTPEEISKVTFIIPCLFETR